MFAYESILNMKGIDPRPEGGRIRRSQSSGLRHTAFDRHVSGCQIELLRRGVTTIGRSRYVIDKEKSVRSLLR